MSLLNPRRILDLISIVKAMFGLYQAYKMLKNNSQVVEKKEDHSSVNP